MDFQTKSTTRRFSFNKRKKSVEPEVKPLAASVLEEAKRLEYLNRKITKSTCKNIVKQISDYRKSTSPTTKKLDNNDSNLMNFYEHLLKKPLNELKTSSACLDPVIKNFDPTTLKQPEKRQKPAEFADIDFKDTMWPEESTLDDKLFDIITSNDFKRHFLNETLIERKPKIRNIRIKSRIGEIGRKFTAVNRKKSANDVKRLSPRVLTPWTYSGNGYSCISSPYV